MRHQRKLILVSTQIPRRRTDFVFNVVTEAEQVVPLNRNKCWPVLSIFNFCTHYHYFSAYLFAVFDRAGGSCDKFSGLPCQPPALAWNMTKYNINTVYTLGHTHTIPILNTGCNCKAVRSCGLWRYKLQRTANLPAKRHNLPILAAGLSCLCWQIFCNFDCLPQIRSLVWCRPNHRNTDDADALTHTTHVLKAVSHIV